jgi:hypothetical protein
LWTGGREGISARRESERTWKEGATETADAIWFLTTAENLAYGCGLGWGTVVWATAARRGETREAGRVRPVVSKRAPSCWLRKRRLVCAATSTGSMPAQCPAERPPYGDDRITDSNFICFKRHMGLGEHATDEGGCQEPSFWAPRSQDPTSSLSPTRRHPSPLCTPARDITLLILGTSTMVCAVAGRNQVARGAR